MQELYTDCVIPSRKKYTFFELSQKRYACVNSIKMQNTLQHIRKNVLKIKSAQKLADLLGGEDDGWYQQKIQRIESGKTNLSESDAFEIATKLQKLGYNVHAWHFFAPPDTLEKSINHVNHIDKNTFMQVYECFKRYKKTNKIKTSFEEDIEFVIEAYNDEMIYMQESANSYKFKEENLLRYFRGKIAA